MNVDLELLEVEENAPYMTPHDIIFIFSACLGKPADVALILDNSGSIRPNQYRQMMEFIETLVLSLDIGSDKTRVAVITFANDAVVRFDLNKYSDGLDVVDALMTMRRQSGGTNTGQALQKLREETFLFTRGARPNTLKLAIVITDGKSRDTDDTLRQAAVDRSLGYVLFAVGVGKNLDIDELQGIAGLQYPERFYSAESFEALVTLNDKIIRTTCDCEFNPATDSSPLLIFQFHLKTQASEKTDRSSHNIDKKLRIPKQYKYD